MSDLSASHSSAVPAPIVASPIVTAQTRSLLWLGLTAFLALMAYYFIGVDQGALSIFGDNTVIHEFFHDGRHFLGYPCH